METKILVAYASKYGSTGEIAGKIGDVLRETGLSVDVLPVDRVRDLAPYGAVILGSAVYMGQWRGEAVRFLKRHAARLAALPVWLFSSGPTGEGDPVGLLNGWRYPASIKAQVERIQPRDTAVFHGWLNPGRINPFEKWIIKNVHALDGDFRKWDAIVAWASSIAAALREARPA